MVLELSSYTIEFFKLHPLSNYFRITFDLKNLHLYFLSIQSYTLEVRQNWFWECKNIPTGSVIVLFLAPVVSVRPQEFIQFTLAPRNFGELIILEFISYTYRVTGNVYITVFISRN